MAMPIRIGILIAALLLPVTAQAGWFGWLFGNTHTQVVTTQAEGTPAIGVYGLALGAAAIARMMRKRK